MVYVPFDMFYLALNVGASLLRPSSYPAPLCATGPHEPTSCLHRTYERGQHKIKGKKTYNSKRILPRKNLTISPVRISQMQTRPSEEPDMTNLSMRGRGDATIDDRHHEATPSEAAGQPWVGNGAAFLEAQETTHFGRCGHRSTSTPILPTPL